MKKFLHEASFKSYLHTKSLEKKEIALASLDNLLSLIPQIDPRNEDLLPFASNVFVANRVNDNDDIVDTLTTLSFYDLFYLKYVNAEHQRGNILGVVSTVGFTEFGSDIPLSKEQVIALGNKPFNVAVGGVIWSLSKPGVAEYISECSNPESPDYLGLGTSWEIGFDKYNIAIAPNGEKNFSDCIIVSDPQEVARLTPFLRKYKGSGSLPDGRRVYRNPIPEILPYGVGFTGTPAADVSGIATHLTVSVPETLPEPSEAKVTPEKAPETPTISQPNESVVIINEIKNCMEIKTIEELSTKWKEIAEASVVTEFVAKEIQKANEKWQEEVNQQKTSLETAKAAQLAAEKRAVEIETALATVQAKVSEFEKMEQERKAVETFNARMDEISSNYKLDEDLSKVVAGQIKAIASDEDFGKWKEQASVMMKAYAKKKCAKGQGECTCDECKKEKEMEMEEAKKKACAKASLEAQASKEKEDAQAALDAALDAGKETPATIPNAGDTTQETFREKFAKHFTLKEGFEFNFKNRRV